MPSPFPVPYPLLVGDIGGTNARFGLVRGAGEGVSDFMTLPCAEFSGPRQAIEHYLDRTGAERPRWCAFGIASPVADDTVSMTNRAGWSFSIRALKSGLGLERLMVLNDFTALAHALPALSKADLVQVGGGKAVKGCAIGLLGPGTGLGVSGLVPCGTHYAAIEGEGGHATLAAADAREAAIIAWLQRRFPHVSSERVLSGPGLVSLYQAHADLAGQVPELLDASEVATRGLAVQCPYCAAAVDSFCAMLGSAAGNLALVLGARGGVYIGGGIVPRLGDYFARSPFRARFEQKGRFVAYLAQIPTYVIHAPYPALLGAARALEAHPA